MVSQFDYTTLENYDKAEFEIEKTKLIKYIGKNKKVKVPEGVTSIGAYAFKGCDWITEIYIPYGANDIDYTAFKGCNNIKAVEIPIRALKKNKDIKKYFERRYKDIDYSISFGDSEDLPRVRELINELNLRQRQEKQEGINLDINFEEEDPLIKDVLNIYLTESFVTALSLSQKLHISYERVNDILNFLEKNRFIGPHENMSMTREVYATADIYKSLFGEAPCAVEQKEAEETIEEIEKILNPNLVKDALTFIAGKEQINYTRLQRKFSLMYKTAKRILKLFEYRGYVGPEQKDGWRKVYVSTDLHNDFHVQDPPIDYNHEEFEIDGTALIRYKGEDSDVRIPQGITTIDNSAFVFCEKINAVRIPNSVEIIGDGAFLQCRGLKRISIPQSVKSIGTRAFYGCNELSTINIPRNVTKIGHMAFDSKGLLEINVEEGNPVYHSENNCLVETASKTLILGCRNSVIPTDGSVEIIGADAFFRCSKLENMDIPKSVLAIEESAFYECVNLNHVTIPDSVKSIGECAFNGCSRLTQLIIPDSVTDIGKSAFSWCKGLEAINLSNSIKELSQYLFYGCESLKSFAITNNITSIGDGAFGHCISLKDVKASNVVSIGNTAFYKCSSLTEIDLPDCVELIGNGAFSGCKSLKSFIVPNKVTKIEQEAFKDCNNLENVVLHFGITSIGQSSFSDCINLQGIILPSSIKLIGGHAFSGCKSIGEVIIPNSLVLMGPSSFIDCDKLNKVTLPKRLVLKESDLQSYFGESYKKIEYVLSIPDSEPEILIITEETKKNNVAKEQGIPQLHLDIDLDKADPLLKDCLRLFISTQKVSTSMIQRKFAVGYNRAARLIDTMESYGFIGPLDDSYQRNIYITEQIFKHIFKEDI